MDQVENFEENASALFGIMTAWVQGGMKDDPDHLARLICDIYQEKIRRF